METFTASVYNGSVSVPSSEPDHAVCGRDERSGPAQRDGAVAVHAHRKSGKQSQDSAMFRAA